MLNNDDFFIHSKEWRGIESIARLRDVKRWHMVGTSQAQSLGEHSANVALLAAMIAYTAPIFWFDNHTSIALVALTHDIAEVFTGDIPSHTKQYLSGMEDLEDKVTHPTLEWGIEITYRSKMLIKICDIADGIRFIRSYGVGSAAARARTWLEDKLTEKFNQLSVDCWPEHVISHVRRNVVFYIYERE